MDKTGQQGKLVEIAPGTVSHWQPPDGLCVSSGKMPTTEADNVQCGLASKEAGWTTERSPNGLEVLEAEQSSWNVLAQYLHNIIKLHFSF
jgi:hypothetical protein